MNMKFLNLISFFFILIFGLFDTINAMVIPSDCAVVEEVINTIGNDLQKTYNNLSIINCCDFPQITCQNLDNEIVVTEIKFNNYINLSNQDMEKIVSQLAKLQHLTTLEMSNNLIIGELPSNLSELKSIQKLDLSGNCLENKNANTNLDIKELNISNIKTEACSDENKEEKVLNSNMIIKIWSFLVLGIVSFTLLILFYEIILRFCKHSDAIRISMLILSITTCALYLILIGSLLFGIYQGKLIYMLIFKFGYLVAICLNTLDLCLSGPSNNDVDTMNNPYLASCIKLLVVIFHIIYYIVAINYINKYIVYLNNK